MNYEKLYKESLERATYVKENTDSVGAKDVSDVIEYIFHGFKESEDEKIRKDIIQTLKRYVECVEDGHDAPSAKDFVIRETESQISWLEKQGEQEINDEDTIQSYSFYSYKGEPDFEVGDWIVDNCGYTWKIEGILNQFYLLEGVEGGESRPTIEWVNKTFRLWTIEDAKKGDVLYCENSGIEYIVMSKGVNEHGNIDSYCRYNSLDGFGVNITSVLTTRQNNITPATKEQRNLLFSKMKEAGYEWDAEKKELKLLITNGGEFFESENCEQNPNAWVEDDEEMFDAVLADIRFTQNTHNHEVNQVVYEKEIDWLKSLKDRVQCSQTK